MQRAGRVIDTVGLGRSSKMGAIPLATEGERMARRWHSSQALISCGEREGVVFGNTMVEADLLELKYGPREGWHWGPRLREQFNYLTPDDHYERFLYEAVRGSTVWLDVGGGRSPLPQNPALAAMLSRRCRLLVGLDPSENVESNPYVHQRVRSSIEDYQSNTPFDLVTFRMVAEHIENPEAVIAALSRLVTPGGCVVIYTIWKWAPVSVVAAITPISVHHRLKRLLWDTHERDTFPVVYKMNTRGRLRLLFSGSGFAEERFDYLDDCRSFQRWKTLNGVELTVRSALRFFGLHYPEVCMLAVYRKG